MNNGTSIKICPAVWKMANTQEHETTGIINNECLREEFKRRQRKISWRKDQMKRKLSIQCEFLLPVGID